MYLGGELAGAKRLACICVVSSTVGRSGATGLYLGGQLAGAERLACIQVVSWQEQSDVMFLGYSTHIFRIHGRYLMLEGCPKSSF